MNFWEEIAHENLLKNATGADEKTINETEQRLGVQFAKDYKEMLAAVGACICRGHELMGISSFADMSTYQATVEQRQLNPSIPSDWYIIERTGMDGVMVFQAGDGVVYQISPNQPPVKIADTLSDYLNIEV